VNPPTIGFASTSLPDAQIGASYNQSVAATGGTVPYSYAVTLGALPLGLSFNASTGAITGVPTQGGPDTFTITATDSSIINNSSAHFIGSQQFTLKVDAPTFTWTPASPGTLAGGTAGTPYSASVSVTGGTAPFSYSLTSGSLPGGLALGQDGTITGTPNVAGTFNFTVQAQDSSVGSAFTSTQSFSIAVASPNWVFSPSTSSLPSGQVGVAYNQSVTATGGNGAITYSIVSGLPAGLHLNPTTGAITGTPTQAGSFTVMIKATDSSPVPFAKTATYALNVAAPTITLTLPTLPIVPQVGVFYSQTITASGGTAPYNFTNGTLPTGLTINPSTGVISGIPTEGGTFSGISIAVTDSTTGTDPTTHAAAPFGATTSITLTVRAPIVNLATTTNVITAPLGVAFSQTIATAAGGIAPYTYSLSGGLPSGLSFNNKTGLLSGTPTVGGTFNFSIQATDSSGTANGGHGPYTSATQSFTLTVQVPTTITFLSQPSDAGGGVLNSFQVQVLDQFGNAYNGPVKLQLTSLTSGGPTTFTSGSMKKVTTVNGVATFGHVTIGPFSATSQNHKYQFRLTAIAGSHHKKSIIFTVISQGRVD
jgi:hypothetical protein